VSGAVDELAGIERLVIEAAAAETATAARLAAWARARGITVERGDAEEGRAAPDRGVPSSKRSLRVVRHQGAVLKPCTGRTSSLLCCNLRVITQTVGCPLDCSYCILQDYQNRSQIVVRADPGEILDTLAVEAAAHPRRLLRVCTGQVGDSLALEPLVGFAAEAVRRCAELPNVVLELKTKTARVEPLLGLPHRGRTIVSFSLAPPATAAREEHGAASPRERLAAAARAAADGYLVAFHLDPMISAGGEAGAAPFRELLDEVAAAVPAARVAALSLGTVRFLPAMRRTVATRFPGSHVTHGELLPDLDGKLRLLAPLRVELYRAVAAAIRERFPEVFLYLCMEPPRIWQRALGASLRSPEEVELALALSLHRRFGLAPCLPAPEDYPPW